MSTAQTLVAASPAVVAVQRPSAATAHPLDAGPAPRSTTAATQRRRRQLGSKGVVAEFVAGAVMLGVGAAVGSKFYGRRQELLPHTVALDHLYPLPSNYPNITVKPDDIPRVSIGANDFATIEFNNRTLFATRSERSISTGIDTYRASDPYAGPLQVKGYEDPVLTYLKDGTEVHNGTVYPTINMDGSMVYLDGQTVYPNNTIDTETARIVPIGVPDRNASLPLGNSISKHPEQARAAGAGAGSLLGTAVVGGLMVVDAVKFGGRGAVALSSLLTRRVGGDGPIELATLGPATV